MTSEIEIIERVEKLLTNLDFNIGLLQGGPGMRPPDIIAIKNLQNDDTYGIGIEIKTNNNLRKAIQDGILNLKKIDSWNTFDKLLLIIDSPTVEDNQALEVLKIYQKTHPTNIELITLKNIENWVNGLQKIFQDKEDSEVFYIIQDACKKLINLIAKNPKHLMNLEWRDLERSMHELFNEIGFSATLTPSSKDGGKDIILDCIIENESKSYVVEIKHWRSKQKVGQKAIKEFTKVIINEGRDKGLFLSTYGFVQNYYECLSETERNIVSFGEESKIVELCRIYEKIKNGIYLPMNSLEDLLFKDK